MGHCTRAARSATKCLAEVQAGQDRSYGRIVHCASVGLIQAYLEPCRNTLNDAEAVGHTNVLY